MIKKIAFNIFLNVAILSLIFIIWSSVKNEQYSYAIGGVLIISVFIYLKVKLAKQVREMTRRGVKPKEESGV